MTGQTELFPLRVHDLKQWDYCPRIVFYNYVMPVNAKSTYKMRYGRAAEDAIDRLERRRKLREFGLEDGTRSSNIWCSSERLSLSGRLDLLIESPAGLFPVDFKASEQLVRSNHITQLCGYALLLEEKFARPVNTGFVFLIPREEIVRIDLTAKRKAACLSALNSMRRAFQQQILPEATDLRSRCDNCEYSNYCGDIF
jgi:CRISPR-associated exonuclease Cas4